MSKSKLISQAEAWLKNPQTYLFDEYRSNLLKSGITGDEPVMKIMDVLRNETFDSYKAKQLEIGEDYLKKLKTLSILSHFYECQSYNLVKLSHLLDVSKQECMKLLLEASINKMITVKIDEGINKILIINSRIRQRQTSAITVKISKGKLTQIRQKNFDVENNINNLINIITPSRKTQAGSTQGLLGKYLSSF